ncbi:MAG TPA: 16S rRNA (cytosine(1402)-N(4))-methyltransferase [Rhodospirillaceae bacterium]|jgi:16S rRNA (cytosine1402-N4)-methyltransferase|nr:16S rRNA (cytosine(1402)-N(4))-methyltransferase RsmH [Alphaproteobacteria bacterium]HBH27160.1 16S rRNA (cytosine(1402)-N(4))-methyltransferase [Rhodospirillaceae bacterium]
MVHTPVLLQDVLSALAPRGGETYVDATFGLGGYSRAILEHAPCRVIALDRDPNVQGAADALKDLFSDRFVFIYGNFANIGTLVPGSVDGIVADLGVSSPQLDQAERGFSFQADGPLDMRMDTRLPGPTAADIVNSYSEKDLADIFHRYGGERYARRVARKIVRDRPFARTGTLAEAIRAVVPRSPRQSIDPATRSFQALRIAVNDEIGALNALLEASPALLRPGGRLVVVSFHSLEDGAVKAFFRQTSGGRPATSRHTPELQTTPSPALFRSGGRKHIVPCVEEVVRNPRARSARMRWAIRTEVPAQ